MNAPSVHDDWLSLIEISGPFLAVPVLKEAFPQGLEELNGIKRKRLRQAYEEWREALELEDVQFAELHAAWIDEVLSRGLELDADGKGDVLRRADWCAANLQAYLPEHAVTLSPALAVVDEQRANKPLLLIQIYAQDVDLDATLKQDGWAATPADRMVQLCRSLGCRLGLITNGERWMLVDAPVGAVTTFASWYARIWSQEPITLQAFVHLLGIRRFFFDESEQLPALFDRSLKFQDEVTDALGEQVRRAVEVLIQTLDKADQDRNRELLHGVKEPELYEAALTVMMRLVFLLSAEERGLLLMGDERYEANYALSTLRMQLRKESEEILERRWDAWSRLLAIFRAVFGGIEHENLRLPALGGSLFDPDRFPFLEGRAKGSTWHIDAAKPLPIDNRTVLLLMEAIQQFQGRTLSYRALDVEQIGYVYEGLLERTVKRTDEVTLELDATKSAKTPWIKLAELDSARLDGVAKLAKLLQERSGSSASRVRNDLAKPVDDNLADRLLTACQGDTKLRDRVKPYAHLLRTDPWGYPLVYPAGAFIVTTGSDRRETGTHYTPKSLTEAIVIETLTPVVYVGPAEGTPREQWVLKSPAELLNLKICDPAMGSGAFLVQACRWLADRLVEAWSKVEATGKTLSVDGEVLDAGVAKEPLPRDSEARTVIARRLIAERCLYGVDLNPLAVELAKLSIWLVTLAKGHPFGFLDHNLRCGDSLLGIHRLDQLTELTMAPTGKGQQRLFGQNIERAVREAIELRLHLRAIPIRDIQDVEVMARLDAQVHRILEVPQLIADAFIGNVFASEGNRSAFENEISLLAIQAGQAIDGNPSALKAIHDRGREKLSAYQPSENQIRRPFHWPLEFPEVFLTSGGGFDSIIGNPPFLGGVRVSELFGTKYNDYLATVYSPASKKSDLSVFFFRRADLISSNASCFGFVATKTVAQGKSRQSGLDVLLKNGTTIYKAETAFKWPGAAAVLVCIVHATRRAWQSRCLLDGIEFSYIDGGLIGALEEEDFPLPINESKGLAYQGSSLLGMGFILSATDAKVIVDSDPSSESVIFPYIGGQDINRLPKLNPLAYAINFGELEERDAKEYRGAWQHIERAVKPERMLKDVHAYPRLVNEWWKYWHSRRALYDRIKNMQRVLVCARVSKRLMLRFCPATWVFNDKVIVFSRSSYAEFAVLQSSFHEDWAWKYGSTLKADLNYVAKSCHETFPFPMLSEDLENVGLRYYELRSSLMLKYGEGLTAIHNRLHDENNSSEDVCAWRNICLELELAVAKAYRWEDLITNGGQKLDYGFHDTKRGRRLTIGEECSRDALRRLLLLNRPLPTTVKQNSLEEVKKSKQTPSTNKKATTPSKQSSLDFSNVQGALAVHQSSRIDSNQWGSKTADRVLAWLEAHPGWFGKQAVLTGCGAELVEWDAAIAELLGDEFIETHTDGNRWRAKP